MSTKIKTFYWVNKEIPVYFSAREISSESAIVLLEKLERKHKIINRFTGAPYHQDWK